MGAVPIPIAICWRRMRHICLITCVRLVPLLLEQRWEQFRRWVNAVVAILKVGVLHVVKAHPPRIAAGLDGGTRGGAQLERVVMRQLNALSHQRVDVWGDGLVSVLVPEIVVAEVIRQHEHNVRRLLLARARTFGCRRRCCSEEQQEPHARMSRCRLG